MQPPPLTGLGEATEDSQLTHTPTIAYSLMFSSGSFSSLSRVNLTMVKHPFRQWLDKELSSILQKNTITRVNSSKQQEFFCDFYYACFSVAKKIIAIVQLYTSDTGMFSNQVGK